MKKILFIIACFVGFVSLTSFKNNESTAEGINEFEEIKKCQLLERFQSEDLFREIESHFCSQNKLRIAHFNDTTSLLEFADGYYLRGWDKNDFIYCCEVSGLLGNRDTKLIPISHICQYEGFNTIITQAAKGETKRKNWLFLYDEKKMTDTYSYYTVCYELYEKVYSTYLLLCETKGFYPNIMYTTNKKEIKKYGPNDYSCLIDLMSLFEAAAKEFGTDNYDRSDLINAFSVFERMRFGAPYTFFRCI